MHCTSVLYMVGDQKYIFSVTEQVEDKEHFNDRGIYGHCSRNCPPYMFPQPFVWLCAKETLYVLRENLIFLNLQIRFLKLTAKPVTQGPALWRNWLGHSLRCPHPIWALVWVLTTPLQIQVLADIFGIAAEVTQVPVPSPPMWESAGFNLAQFWLLWLFGNLANTWKVSVAPQPCNSTFQTNK